MKVMSLVPLAMDTPRRYGRLQRPARDGTRQRIRR
jgi:hypothetical protein